MECYDRLIPEGTRYKKCFNVLGFYILISVKENAINSCKSMKNRTHLENLLLKEIREFYMTPIPVKSKIVAFPFSTDRNAAS